MNHGDVTVSRSDNSFIPVKFAAATIASISCPICLQMYNGYCRCIINRKNYEDPCQCIDYDINNNSI